MVIFFHYQIRVLEIDGFRLFSSPFLDTRDKTPNFFYNLLNLIIAYFRLKMAELTYDTVKARWQRLKVGILVGYKATL